MMVVTTSVLFWRLSTISVYVSLKFLLIFTPRLSVQVPTWDRNKNHFLKYLASNKTHKYFLPTLVNPSLFNSIISNSKSVLWPRWSNFIFPVRPSISTYWHNAKYMRTTEWFKLNIAHQLHEVDEAVAVLPGLVAVARQRRHLDVLRLVELVQRRREQVHRVVDERSLRLKSGVQIKLESLHCLNDRT